MKEMTLEQAKKKIEELKVEIALLKEENEELKKVTPAGRKKHDAKWTKRYNDFVARYERGETLVEIAKNSNYSLRTAYRFLTYYKEVNGK